jgi:hypothetical protein
MSKVNNLEPRACEICGKNDVLTNVHSSSIGPVSCNYCQCCDIVRAENKFMQEFVPDLVWYNKKDDKYYRGDTPIPTEYNINGTKLNLPTRSDLAKHCIKAVPEEKPTSTKLMKELAKNPNKKES